MSLCTKVRGGRSLRHTPQSDAHRACHIEDVEFLTFCNHATDDESKTTPDGMEVVRDVPTAVAETEKPTGESEDTKTSASTIDPEALKVAALEDANRIKEATLSIDLDKVGVKDARIIMSEEHKSLGYRPPPDSLAAKAQRSSTKHPHSSLGLDAAMLREAARADAERIK
jgi:hypothetical protein